MPALNFQSRFAALVVSGKKRQTIRATRKHPIRDGATLYLYTGMRTKQCRRLLTARCTRAGRILIVPDAFEFEWPSAISGLMNRKWETRRLSLDSFAIADGFADWPELLAWFEFTHGLPFRGQLIEWEPYPRNNPAQTPEGPQAP